MNWKRKLYYSFGPKMRRTVRRLYYFPADVIDTVFARRKPMVPPRGKIFIGPGNFTALGEKLRSDFIRYGGLKPEHSVLDIGCGIGRIAIPLTEYLNKQGKYEGFDIVKEGIDWCKNKIQTRFPNFRFTHIDLRNDLYNLSTGRKAEQFVFPYADSSFDFIILTSVFTHMQSEEVKQYLNEIARVMKKGGTCFVTFFLINEEASEFLKNSKNPFFAYEYDTYFLHDKQVKDANIAFKTEFILDAVKSSGMYVKETLPGWWAGRDKQQCVDFQDVLLLSK